MINKNFVKFLTTSLSLLAINSSICYCMQYDDVTHNIANNIVYDNYDHAVPDKDNNGRIIENTNFFFDEDYLSDEYDNIKQQLKNQVSDISFFDMDDTHSVNDLA